MKLIYFILLLLSFQLFAINSYSQDEIVLKLKNTPLKTIIKQIEEQSPYRFIYNNDKINDIIKLNVNVENKNINTVLKKLLVDTSIQYLVENKSIVLFVKPSIKKNQRKSKFTLSGIVKDAATGETLFGANLRVKNSNKGVVSNEYGFYSITLEEKKYTFQISYLGYKTKEIEVDLNKSINLDIELEPESDELDEVIITSNNTNKSQVRAILTGAVNLQSKEIKQVPAFFGEPDITRVILTQPGISTVGEATSGFNVRGGNIDQNLVLLDEAPVYNSSHLWGFFSIFNTDAIKNLKLYKGGIPARFGGRASSVLDIRQKEGNTKEFKGEGGLGLLFSRLTLEGPIKKEKVSFLISGRRSYFDLFFPLLGEEVKDNKIYFYDLNTKLTWNINSKNKLFISGYFGADVMKLNFEENVVDGVKEADEEIDFRWKNATATLRWNHLFSDKLFMNVSGIYSRYNYILSSNNDPGGGPAKTSGTFDWESSVENWIFKPDFTYYTNDDSKIRFGVHNTLYQFKPAKVESTESGINTIAFQTEKGLEIAPYFEYEKRWNKLSLNMGLRYSWFGNIGSYNVSNYDSRFPKSINTITGTTEYKKGDITKDYSNFEPRLAINYALNDYSAIKLGYNRTSQYLHLISNTAAALPFDVWKLAGKHIKPLVANQISGGYAHDTKNRNYSMNIEAYYKSLDNLVEYKNGADLFLNENIETQLLPAKGYAYGTEFTLHKNKGKITGNINYTYSVTKRKTTSEFVAENINGGDYYSSNYDRPHILNITTNYRIGKKWSFSSFFTYQTGKPYTKPTSRIRINGIEYLSYSDRNVHRLLNTHRLDISFTHTPKGNPNTKWKGSWNFGVYNVYGRENTFSRYSTFNISQLKTFQFSIIGSPIPFITYNFKF